MWNFTKRITKSKIAYGLVYFASVQITEAYHTKEFVVKPRPWIRPRNDPLCVGWDV